MKPHTIELQELQKWVSETEVLFTSSSREAKRLTTTLNGGLRVIVGKEIVWQGIQPYSAVEAYNSITDEYIDK